MDNESLVEMAGWLGVVFYVIAYFLLSTGALQAKSYRFHTLNILGASGLIADSAYYGDKPNLVVNVIWLVIGIFAIAKRYFDKSSDKLRNL